MRVSTARRERFVATTVTTTVSREPPSHVVTFTQPRFSSPWFFVDRPRYFLGERGPSRTNYTRQDHGREFSFLFFFAPFTRKLFQRFSLEIRQIRLWIIFQFTRTGQLVLQMNLRASYTFQNFIDNIARVELETLGTNLKAYGKVNKIKVNG